MNWTPALAIEKRLEIREEKAARKKEFDIWYADKTEKEALLDSYLLAIMNERGEEQIKTDKGTAYKSPQMRCTMTDRQAVIQFTLDRVEQNDPNAFDLFTNHISKEAVKLLEEAQIVVPGIKVDKWIDCNVRKA